MQRVNPLLALPFESSLEALGDSYWDVVEAARFPQVSVRFRNDPLLWHLGVDPGVVTDADVEAAFGRFQGRSPFLALRYHGHQFGTYNPLLGDGRGFLYGQLRDRQGVLQDLGTKGSGTTPWSRGGDGRLTLRGGVRELMASEALHRLGVTTCRTLSLIETGEALWRADEPSPTRSAVMVRMMRTHLRFGTLERLHALRDRQGLERLLRHVVAVYYPAIAEANPALPGDRRALQRQVLLFYAELVQRVARLAAEWMAAGFVHGVLNTDNMSLVGESFDYGPFAFLERWDPAFTAASFDRDGLYAFGRQPAVCHSNLERLQNVLAVLLPRQAMDEALEPFGSVYRAHYRHCFLRRLGLDDAVLDGRLTPQTDPVSCTLALLESWPVAYGDWFAGLVSWVQRVGLPHEPDALAPFLVGSPSPPREVWLNWRDAWWQSLQHQLQCERGEQGVMAALIRCNLPQPASRSLIQALWEAIDQRDDWEPLATWLADVRLPG